MDNWFAKKLELTRKVRFILVEYRIDLERAGIHVHPHHVVLRGSLVRRAGEGTPLDAMLVQQLLSDISRIKDVRRVDLDLDNWVVDGVGVKATGMQKAKKRGKTED